MSIFTDLFAPIIEQMQADPMLIVKQIVMWIIGGTLIFLAIKKDMEPTLLLPMGFGTLLIAHVTFNLPYVILNVMPKLQQMNPALQDAAMDLGCTPIQSFFKVTIPEIMPGIITGFLMAFTYSLDDFVVSYFTAGNVQTLSITIYSMVKKRVSPEINALSTILFVVVLMILLFTNVRSIKKERAKEKKMMKN